MKLRIRGNSLRLRLSQSEVTALVEDGKVEDAISFGGPRLVYALHLANDLKEIGATFVESRILVAVPGDRGRRWAESDDVGIEHDDGTLRILVEKDFACLRPREGEGDEDAFPHPKAERAD